MAYDDKACYGLDWNLVVGVGWDGPGGGGWGVNRVCNFVFSVSHLFQLSCPSWRGSSIVMARHKCNIELPTGTDNEITSKTKFQINVCQ